MKKSLNGFVPILLALLILVSLVWYCFVYDRDFTRDMLLNQARYHSTNGNPNVASWFYDLAYEHSGQDEGVAIELANQFKADGNYTKAEYTLSNAIADGGTADLYIALCKTYVEQDKLLDAVNMLDNIADSKIKAEIDSMRPAAPTSDPVSGFYSQYISVSLESSGGTLYFTTDGEYPSTAETSYSEPFALGSGETTVLAISVLDNGLVSPRSIFSYTVGGVIEEVSFTDEVLERTIRELLDRNDEKALFSNELWNISEFTAPADVTHFDDLTKLSHLQKLTIENQTFSSLSFLTALNDLTELTLHNCRFQSNDIETIAALPKLTKLTLTNCSLSTVAGLENAVNLEYLNLANNTIKNLEPLAHLVQLREIDLQHNALTGLSALSGLTNLQKLNVSYNSLTSVASLATCSKLNWIDANHNDLINLDGVINLQELEYLSASNNALTDVSSLTTRTTLKELYIANNEIEDISSFGTLINLEVLDFATNKVKYLPAWSNDAKLRVIDGSYNEVESLDPLKNLMQLTHIYMDYNKIESVSVLESCYKLVLVNVYGNDIDSVRELTAHDIIVNWDPT